jgi:hypothetical protein
LAKPSSWETQLRLNGPTPSPPSPADYPSVGFENDELAVMLRETHMLPTTHRYVTAHHERGHISMDGRSETSKFWAGGAAYDPMCATCGLAPIRSDRPGLASNCFCMCDTCKRPLHGLGSLVPLDADNPGGLKHHLCAKCGGDAAEVIPICTREVKAKRPRSSYLPWHARPCPTPPDATASIVEAAAAAATVAVAAADVADAAVVCYIYYGCD